MLLTVIPGVLGFLTGSPLAGVSISVCARNFCEEKEGG